MNTLLLPQEQQQVRIGQRGSTAGSVQGDGRYDSPGFNAYNFHQGKPGSVQADGRYDSPGFNAYNFHQGKPGSVQADGRYDSPGFNAYSFQQCKPDADVLQQPENTQ
eukprot:TRINITY_DN8124_c0_g1_i2.p1 TRINITY_DN8124_c0_g1~~TRINITY_DN8124_c0_g1_i2.p1  ORF type:complete len:107 (-),score=19.85 TRINITY_DN8124_c0_g1_i2:198-518(-)